MYNLAGGTAAVFDGLPDAALLLDREGVVVAANPAATAQAADGCNPVGRPLQETWLKEAAPTLLEALRRVRPRQPPVAVDHSTTLVERQVHHEFRLVAMPEEQVLLLIRDVTGRKLAEHAMQESAARFRVLADNITDVFWIRSPDMRELRYVSPAFEKIWGRPVPSLYGQPLRWVDFIVPEDREHVARTFAGLTADSPSLDLEYRIVRPDGERRWVRVRGFQVRDAQGTLIWNTGIVTDVTERKLAQAQLDATHKQLVEASRHAGMAEVATNVLHNVGNILNSVTVSAGLLRANLRASRAQGLHRALQMMSEHAGDLGQFLSSDEKGRLLPGYLAGIAQALLQEQHAMQEELEHLTRSIDHIREVVVTQQAYARRGGYIAAVQAAELMKDALRMNAQSLERHGVAVVTQYEPVPPARLDRSRVLQILVNLIGNARDALHDTPPAERRVTVRVQPAGANRLRMVVRDEGEGIPRANLTRIFAHGFTTRKHGHGFGLHSCAQAAAEMGGALTVSSDGPGSGATFTLELPLDPVESAP